MEIFEVTTQADKKVNVFQVEENISLVSGAVHHEIGTTGIFSVTAIVGCFDILGAKLTPDSPALEVFSSKEFSLKITPLPQNKSIIDRAYLDSLKIAKNVKEAALAHFSGVDNLLMIALMERTTGYIKYIESYMEMPIFSNKMFEKNIISFKSSDSLKCNSICVHPEWNHWGSTLTKKGKKVVLCGGKGVGKSTLLKYLVNRSVSSGSQALVLDFDPGQPEFTVMGCVSVILITKPLLGPNFTHLITPIKCLYLGCISVSDYSKEYMACVKKIIDFCTSTVSFQDIPWFINTMGFVKGLGVTLLKDIILNIQPTDVIQINSKKKNDNLPERMTPEFVLDKNFSFAPSLKYKLHTTCSMTVNTGLLGDPVTWGINPAKKRSIVALTYFYDMLNSSSLNFLECIPYRISAKAVRVIVTANDTPIRLENFHKLSCINGNMVALCVSENYSDFLECKGYGIVRGVDFEKEDMYINTPMGECELEQISVIHMSSMIQLPPAVFKKQLQFVQNTLPYTARVYPSRMNQMIRKTTSRIRPNNMDKSA